MVMHAEELTGRDTLDTTSTSETADGGLGDALDVVSQDFAMPLGSSFSQSLSSLSASGHGFVSVSEYERRETDDRLGCSGPFVAGENGSSPPEYPRRIGARQSCYKKKPVE